MSWLVLARVTPPNSPREGMLRKSQCTEPGMTHFRADNLRGSETAPIVAAGGKWLAWRQFSSSFFRMQGGVVGITELTGRVERGLVGRVERRALTETHGQVWVGQEGTTEHGGVDAP